LVQLDIGRLKQMVVQERELMVFVTVLVLINTLIAGWSLCNHSVPVYDMAWHLFSGLKCCDLLSHPHLRSYTWWQSLFSVGSLYPPFVYLIYGILKLLLGTKSWVDILVHSLFASVLFASICGLGSLIFKKASIGLLAAVIVLIYPQVFLFAHYDMLDMPGLAMVSLALFSFMWWRQKPSYYSAAALGIACSLGALTKNNSIAFIIGPLIASLGSSLLRKEWHRIKSLAIAALVSMIVILPWLIFGLQPMIKAVTNIEQQSYSAGCTHMFTFGDNLLYYISNLQSLFSPFLLSLFILAFFTASKSIHKHMFYLLLSATSGILLLSLFHWNPLSRYMLPAVIPVALYTASAGVGCLQKPRLHPLMYLLAALAGFAFIETNFAPYPLSELALPEKVKTFLGIPPARQGQYYALGGCSSYPMIPVDWGHDWVLQTIKPRINAINQTLAIMSNTEEVSAATYIYLAKRDHLALCVFTPRNWTMLGDDISFRPDVARSVTWYLLETKRSASQASHLSSKESENSYRLWCRFVRSSGYFHLIGTKSLPDDNRLELYQNISY